MKKKHCTNYLWDVIGTLAVYRGEYTVKISICLAYFPNTAIFMRAMRVLCVHFK